MQTNYVVGFCFNHTTDQVTLVKKLRPEWQLNKWNGVGGHIEGVETPSEAMAREFEEEAGLHTNPSDWDSVARLSTDTRDHDQVFFFRLFATPGQWEQVQQTGDEVVKKWPLYLLRHIHILPNLTWLIPLAVYTHDNFAPINIIELPVKAKSGSARK